MYFLTKEHLNWLKISSDKFFFHTFGWYSNVWKDFEFEFGAFFNPEILLLWPTIRLGELFWGCKYQQITRTNNIVLKMCFLNTLVLWMPIGAPKMYILGRRYSGTQISMLGFSVQQLSGQRGVIMEVPRG